MWIMFSAVASLGFCDLLVNRIMEWKGLQDSVNLCLRVFQSIAQSGRGSVAMAWAHMVRAHMEPSTAAPKLISVF